MDAFFSDAGAAGEPVCLWQVLMERQIYFPDAPAGAHTLEIPYLCVSETEETYALTVPLPTQLGQILPLDETVSFAIRFDESNNGHRGIYQEGCAYKVTLAFHPPISWISRSRSR